MKVKHKVSGAVIEVSNEHFESVLKSQGWMEVKDGLQKEEPKAEEVVVKKPIRKAGVNK